MLKPRLILALTINRGQLCRTKRFIPDRTYSLDFVDLEGADELVVLDVTKDYPEDKENRRKFLDVVEKLSQELFLPLAVGGHVKTWKYARELMNAGADKIIVGHGAIGTPALVSGLAFKLGNSCVVGGIELGGVRDINIAIAEQAVRYGCGELLLQFLTRDGSLEGYDLEQINAVAEAVSVPVIAMSGCGTARHMVEGFQAGAAACATSNIFHFTPEHVRQFKRQIAEAGIEMRAA